MWNALFAFTGGVAAVALKGWVDYLLERRKERRLVQVAARLVYEELWTASAGIETDLFLGNVPNPTMFTTNAWNENKTLVASALDFEHWRLVTVAYSAVEDARAVCIDAKGPRKLAYTNADRNFLGSIRDLQGSIGSARGIVAELIEGAEWDPFPAHDPEHDRQAQIYERRRRRGRLGRKLVRRARARLGRQAVS
jgi:hypothetical protein